MVCFAVDVFVVNDDDEYDSDTAVDGDLLVSGLSFCS